MAGESYIDAKVAFERERGVLIVLARGLTYKDIAEQLGVGVRTIETYRRRVVEELGLRTRRLPAPRARAGLGRQVLSVISRSTAPAIRSIPDVQPGDRSVA